MHSRSNSAGVPGGCIVALRCKIESIDMTAVVSLLFAARSALDSIDMKSVIQHSPITAPSGLVCFLSFLDSAPPGNRNQCSGE